METSGVDQERLLDSFKYLCNTDSANKQLTPQDVDEVRSILKRIKTPAHVNSDPVLQQKSSMKFTDRFKQYMQEKDAKEATEEGLEGEGLMHPPQDRAKEKEEDTTSESGSVSSSSSSSLSRVSSRAEEPPRKRRPETYEQQRMKKNLLVILNTLRQQGYQPTQDYTMQDSLQDIKEEIDQYYMCMEATSFVSKWKNNIETGASMVEIGAQFIPKQPLRLQGLQSKIHEIHESKRVDMDWERIYYTYRRKKAANPIMSLAIAYGLALLSTHVSNYAQYKLNSVLSGVDGGGGKGPLGGLDLGALLQGFLGGFGKQQNKPSLVPGVPATQGASPSAPPTNQGRASSGPRRGGAPTAPPPSAPKPAPPRRSFQRNVYF